MALGELIGLLVMLAALFGMSAVLTRHGGLNSAAAPLAALALTELVLLAAGLLGVLHPADLILAALGLLGGVAEVVLAKKKGETCPLTAALTNPAAKLFWAVALALARGPLAAPAGIFELRRILLLGHRREAHQREQCLLYRL